MRWLWLALDLLVPLVYFVRRRRPVGGVVVGLWWLFLSYWAYASRSAEELGFSTSTWVLAIVALAVSVYIVRRQRPGAIAGVGLWWLFVVYTAHSVHGDWREVSISGWVVGIVAVAFSAALDLDRRRAKVAAAAGSSVPVHSLRRRLGEALLIGGVLWGSVAIAAVGWRAITPEPEDSSRVDRALWEARWIAEQSDPPGDLATDPWKRSWVRSAGGDDVWVCSRGPRGDGPCPPPGLGTPAVARAGSIGYSRRFGEWASAPPASSPSTVLPILVFVAAAVPWVAFAAYRVRRWRSGHPSLRLGSGPRGVVALFIAGLVVAALVPVYANVSPRARVVKAEADQRALTNAIEVYRRHTGVLPRTLDDLTRPATSRDGRQQGPLVAVLPTAPTGGTSQYTYRRRADGRYRLEWWTFEYDRPIYTYGGDTRPVMGGK